MTVYGSFIHFQLSCNLSYRQVPLRVKFYHLGILDSRTWSENVSAGLTKPPLLALFKTLLDDLV